MSLLEELFTKYGTDKGIWGYTPIYMDLLYERRMEVRRVLEIGVCGHRDIPNNVVGASLYAWRDFFPNAQIIGLDNDARWMVTNEPRIRTYCLDAYQRRPLTTLAALTAGEGFDFICDDAIHDPLPQITLLHDLWPFLKNDGVYAIEDVCPYKLLHDDLAHMTRLLPPGVQVRAHKTHKAERLLIASHSTHGAQESK